MQSEEKRNLASKNYMEKHGVSHQFYDKNIREKIQNTIKKHIEDGTYKRRENFLETMARKFYDDLLTNPYVIPMFSYDEYKIARKIPETVLKWKCLECGSEFSSRINLNYRVRFERNARCLKCHPYISTGDSNEENELFLFLKSVYDGKIERHLRNIIYPYELDFYFPEKKLAVEFNGLIWHSEWTGVDNKYHLMKTQMCEKQGIRLLHIFEDEWIYKKDIVMSKLRYILNHSSNKIYARQCNVVEIPFKTAKKFIDDNHLQGSTKSEKVCLGLYHEGDLISVMTFSKPRFSKKNKYEWELVRFCNKLDYSIPGGASKLLVYFEKKYFPKSIISYADRRWSDGSVYKKLNFKFIHNSEPNYFYFRSKTTTRESRIKFQKHKLPIILKNFNPELSESENMFQNGYYKIYDCGNMVFEKIY